MTDNNTATSVDPNDDEIKHMDISATLMCAQTDLRFVKSFNTNFINSSAKLPLHVQQTNDIRYTIDPVDLFENLKQYATYKISSYEDDYAAFYNALTYYFDDNGYSAPSQYPHIKNVSSWLDHRRDVILKAQLVYNLLTSLGIPVCVILNTYKSGMKWSDLSIAPMYDVFWNMCPDTEEFNRLMKMIELEQIKELQDQRDNTIPRQRYIETRLIEKPNKIKTSKPPIPTKPTEAKTKTTNVPETKTSKPPIPTKPTEAKTKTTNVPETKTSEPPIPMKPVEAKTKTTNVPETKTKTKTKTKKQQITTVTDSRNTRSMLRTSYSSNNLNEAFVKGYNSSLGPSLPKITEVDEDLMLILPVVNKRL